MAKLHPEVMKLTPTPTGRPDGATSAIFSPRKPLDILDWYADLAKDANEAVFMTFAFGMGDVFKRVFREGRAPLRFALMEKPTRPMKAGPEREAELEAIRQLRLMDENLFAIGSHLRTNRFDAWLAEKLTGLNSNVRYVHNKFMVLDPLSDDPIVIGGSANFSKKSTDSNDENMLVIRGDRRVADIYLGEFMRLYTHHAFREFAARRATPIRRSST
ncbi:phospholipase D-like domain-containing protein [Neoaquamicrobium sediminum]|uniref:phospholipase D-like domain-containing protein n=1 Tax=Neoaquamicrobium sediminum TaxID=1849104 RepID=UPI0019D6887F|nr:phospholipase D-like domain-containing protein [Mesorhizobium sediminum]